MKFEVRSCSTDIDFYFYEYDANKINTLSGNLLVIKVGQLMIEGNMFWSQ